MTMAINESNISEIEEPAPTLRSTDLERLVAEARRDGDARVERTVQAALSGDRDSQHVVLGWTLYGHVTCLRDADTSAALTPSDLGVSQEEYDRLVAESLAVPGTGIVAVGERRVFAV